MRITSTLLFIFFFTSLSGQDHSAKRLILSLNHGENIASLNSEISSLRSNFPAIKELKYINSENGIAVIEFSEIPSDLNEMSVRLKNLRSIQAVQFDRKVHLRNTPNDPLFSDQWNMDIIDAIRAWDISTGGTNKAGHDIVIAVVDNGFDIDHEDLIDNLWTNSGEIPGDGMDNDNNGYIDDYYGLNILTGNDQHQAKNHGTGVCGILGAKGNNNKGLSGVCWNIKIMLLSGASFESQIIEAYQYARTRRALYNSSNGAQGDFVVVTNSSFGIDNGNAQDFPLWCNQYELLGSAGILSVVSTTNSETNVDIMGDMPSTCASDYMIAVTNTTRNDLKLAEAGYGVTHIDLGAPGDDTQSTEPFSSYGGFGGTSASCPHVAGAVALLYSIECDELEQTYLSNPASAALSLKNVILDNVDAISDLNGITKTGGRLNLYNSMLGLEVFCGASLSENFEITSLIAAPDLSYFTLEYETNTTRIHKLSIFDMSGRLVGSADVVPPLFGMKETRFRTQDLAFGVYVLHFDNGSTCVSKRFTIY